MKLSNNFTLEEFLVSQTAARHSIDMTPPDFVIDNLQRLVDDCLQPLRHQTGPIFISSGFRPPDLNKKIGGSRTSAHMYGNACDFKVMGQTPFETCTTIINLGLPFDQLIQEFGRWVHIGSGDTLRQEKLTAYKKDGKTKYSHGILRMEDLQ